MERYVATQFYKADSPESRILRESGMVPSEFVLAADAQATIAALQAKLEDLTAKYQTLVAWYDKQNGTPCEQVRHRQEVEALQARVQELEEWVQDQSTANLETMWHMDEMQSRAMDAESQLTQRTAELEAAKELASTRFLELRNRAADCAEHSEDWARAQVKVNELKVLVNDLHAELERVRGELVEATHNVNVYQSLYSTSCMDRALLENDLRDLRTLIADHKETKHDAI